MWKFTDLLSLTLGSLSKDKAIWKYNFEFLQLFLAYFKSLGLQNVNEISCNKMGMRGLEVRRKRLKFCRQALASSTQPQNVPFTSLGTFRSDYDNDYEYEFFNVYPVRMHDCVRLSRQLVLSSKSRRRLGANYKIFNKSRPPTTTSLQVQRQVKRLVFKGADTLWNVLCNLSRSVLATLWHFVLFVY